MTTVRTQARLQQNLAEITRLLERHRVLETLTHRQEGPRRDLLENLQHRQNLVELQRRLRTMHAADLAYILEALPPEERRIVWDQLTPELAGPAFIEVSNAVRDSLVGITPREDLVRRLSTLDSGDLHYVSASLPEDVRFELSGAFESQERSAFEAAAAFPEDTVGYHMTRELVAIPETYTVQQTLDTLRSLRELPAQTDRLYVVDARSLLRGALPLPVLLLSDPSAPVAGFTERDIVSFNPGDKAKEAVKAFERYDLVSAPVVDDRGKLIGRLTVDAAMDFLREQSNLEALQRVGLTGDEDLFAAPWRSARNRWPWLGVNLLTAFVASRIIGQFEGTIARLSALAALMPIVASIAGNTGNQTMALVIRALALDRLQPGGAKQLVRKELAIGLLKGSVWGAIVGAVAMALYSSASLGVVMTGAVVLNLIVAALAGVAIPLTLHTRGRDPARGSSVLLTFITDAMGFFLFLGLATAFLL
jgi:magnesium transporter